MKRRKREGKTDYKARIALLKSKKARIIFRKTNKYIIGQYIKSREAKDYVVTGLSSKELLKFGWPENAAGSLKSIPASYLTGFLLGKKIMSEEEKEGVFDIGLLRSFAKSRAYAFLKGVVDSGVKVKVKEEMFPDERKIIGQNKFNVKLIKENIENKPLEKVSKTAGIKPTKPLEKVSKTAGIKPTKPLVKIKSKDER